MKKKFTLILLLASLLLLIVPGSVVHAANKGVRFKATYLQRSESDEDEQWDYRTYRIGTLMSSGTKLKSTLTYSGILYLPKSMFKNGGYIGICLGTELYNNDNGEYNSYGGVDFRDWLTFGKEAGEKNISFTRTDEVTGKTQSGSKYASAKEVGNYYQITFKNLRSKSVYTKYGVTNEDNLPIVTTKVFYPMVYLNIHGDFPKTVSGNIYLDKLQIKGAKTITATFDKNDYLFLDVVRSWWRVIPAIAKVPTK